MQIILFIGYLLSYFNEKSKNKALLEDNNKLTTESEIRKGAYAGNFYDMILELKNNEQFRQVCSVSSQKESRGEYEELILRFFAYSNRYLDFKHDVAIFLNEYSTDMYETNINKKIYKIF
jgi:hypothetical protein